MSEVTVVYNATQESTLSEEVSGTPQRAITGNQLNDVAWNGSDTLVMKAEIGLAEPIKQACARLPIGKCLCGRAGATQKIQFADCPGIRNY